jgi:ribonuclease P protein component
MISKSHRFHGYGSLNYVYRNGDTVRGPYFAIKYVRNPKKNSYRLAVVVSRKISKSAFSRNRIRRRLYEAVRGYEANLDNYDMILTVFDEKVKEMAYADLEHEVKRQLKKAGAVKLA